MAAVSGWDSGRHLAVGGGWWRLAVGGWRLALGGLQGLSLRAVLNKKKWGGFLKTALNVTGNVCLLRTEWATLTRYKPLKPRAGSENRREIPMFIYNSKVQLCRGMRNGQMFT